MRKERIILLIPFLIVTISLFRLIAPKSDEYRVIKNNSFWKWKTFDDNTYDIILCGDSRIYRGLSPKAMNEIIKNKKIINFGYGSAGYDPVMFSEIDKRIGDKPKGKILVLGVTPLTLTPEGAHNYHLNFELRTKQEELLELKYFKPILLFFVPYNLSQLAKSIQGKPYQPRSLQQEYMPDGWVASYENKTWQESALKSYSTRFIKNQVNKKQTADLLTQVGKWTAKGVKVFAFRPPTTHKMVALEDSVSGYKEQEIRAALIKNGAVWLNFNIDDYFSYDGSHLQKESAIKLSKNLAIKITQH